MKFKNVLFDLDGTLLSTEEDLAIATNHAFEKFGYKVNATVETIRRGIGVEIIPMLRLAYKEADLAVCEDDFLKIRDEFEIYYAAHNNVYTRPFNGVIDTLKKLNAAGVKTGVISNKPDESARACVNRYFGSLFSFAVGSCVGKPIKPQKEVFYNLAAEYGLIREDCLYVGDMVYDVQFAKNVGMKVAICSYGYGTKQDMANADFVIDEFSQLLQIVL